MGSGSVGTVDLTACYGLAGWLDGWTAWLPCGLGSLVVELLKGREEYLGTCNPLLSWSLPCQGVRVAAACTCGAGRPTGAARAGAGGAAGGWVGWGGVGWG